MLGDTIPYRVQRTINIDHPVATACRPYSGGSMLNRFPNGSLMAASLSPGSRDKLLKTFSEIRSNFASNESIMESWNKFMNDIAPASDEVKKHTARYPLHIPFADTLFNGDYVIDHSKVTSLY